jgi:hypothetical protein
MALDLAAATPRVAVKLATGGIERGPHGDKNIVMHLEFASVATDGDDPARHIELDAEMRHPPGPLRPVATLDDNPAGSHPVENAFQLIGTIAYPLFHRC